MEDNTQGSRRSACPPKEIIGKTCAVCGDRANGYNFGVLTCESCKAFFRRNAAKLNDINCPFSNACQITSASRKFCQSCRLQKCISVGMSSDWLNDSKSLKTSGKRKKDHTDPLPSQKLGDSEDQVSVSKAFLQKLMKQANEKQTCCSCTCVCGFYPTGTRLTALHCVQSPLSNIDKSIYPTSSLNSPTCSSLISSSPLSPYPSPQQLFPIQPATYLPPHIAFQNKISSWNVAPINQLVPLQSYEPSAFTTVISSSNNDLVCIVNKKIEKYKAVLAPDEMAMLEELHILNDPLNAPLEKNYNQESLHGVFRIVEEALRRIIGMAARLKAFQDLDIEDRKLLMKSGFCELLIVRGVMAYDKANNSWNHKFADNNMEVKVDILKQDPKTLEHYEMHKKLLESFSDEIRRNDDIMLIFNAIVIFHPRVSNLKDSKKVHSTQAKYFSLLLKILMHEFPKDKANATYEILLDLVIDLHHVNQTMLHIFYGFDPTQLDPLVRELCNFT